MTVYSQEKKGGDGEGVSVLRGNCTETETWEKMLETYLCA